MSIGNLLKNYRIQQGKKQKEFIGNVMSQSYYSRVEKDAHRITVDDLISLLHYNNIPLWEFFGQVSQMDNISSNQIKQFSTMMRDAYYSSDKTKLERIKELIDESNLSPKDKDEQKLLVDGWLESMKKNLETPNKELRIKLKEKIFNSPSFNKETIILYCNFMAFYDLNSNILISKNIINQYVLSDDSDIQGIVLSIIANIMAISIEKNKYSHIDFYIDSAHKIKSRPQNFFYKNGVLFFENLINYKRTKQKECLDLCNRAVNTYIDLGVPTYGAKLKEFLQQNLK